MKSQSTLRNESSGMSGSISRQLLQPPWCYGACYIDYFIRTKIVKNLQATFDDTFAGSDDLQDQIKESVTQSKIQYFRFL